MFLTDGMLERNADDRRHPGAARQRGDDHPREAVQRLISSVLEADGFDAQDDATALCFDWHGGPELV